jgi:hypothetical protein
MCCLSINQSVSHHNIMVLLPYVSQLSNVTSQLKNIYGLYVQYTPSVSTIKLSGPTYSSQNVRQMSDKFESQQLFGRTFWSEVRVDIKRFFFYISRGEYVKHFVIDAYL